MMEGAGVFANGHSALDTKKSDETTSLKELGTSFETITGQVADVTHGLSVKALSVVKEYPIHTALAAAGVGFIVGAFVNRK